MNKRTKPTVALIFGGRGYEKEVSVRGANNLSSLIPSEKYEKIPIFIAADGRFLMPEADATPAEMASGEAQMRECYPALRDGRGGFAFNGGFMPIDAAFPLLHGDYGEDGVVQGALECARIAYVGCDVIGSAVARDKILLKAIAGSLSIPTARGILCQRGEENRVVRESEATFGYPVFVKPTRLGSSVGAGKAENRRELRLALAKALSLGDRAMIEEYIDIEKELEIAYFAPQGRKILTSPGEIKANGFYDYEKKYGSSLLQRSEAKRVGEGGPLAVDEVAGTSSTLSEMQNESGTSRVLLRLGHAREKTILNRFLTLSRRFATSSPTVESISLPPRGRCRTDERRKEPVHECSTHCLNAQTHSPSPDSVGSSLPERASMVATVTESISLPPRGRCRTNERRKEPAHECSTHCLNAQTHSPSPDSVGSSLPERASMATTVTESISLPPRGRCRTDERRKEPAHESSTHCLNAQTHSPSPDSVGSSLPERASMVATVTEFASVDSEVETLAKDYAARLARFLSLRDLSRIDFFLSKDGKLYFNEINTMPGFTETSLYMRLVARCGISPEMLVCALIDGAMTRGG